MSHTCSRSFNAFSTLKQVHISYHSYKALHDLALTYFSVIILYKSLLFYFVLTILVFFQFFEFAMLFLASVCSAFLLILLFLHPCLSFRTHFQCYLFREIFLTEVSKSMSPFIIFDLSLLFFFLIPTTIYFVLF